MNTLVTGRLAGANLDANDVDRGVTSIRAPTIALPATGTLTLHFYQYLAPGSGAGAAADDFLRVTVIGTTRKVVLQSTSQDLARGWEPAAVDLGAFAGESIRLLIKAADGGVETAVEAGIDDVLITRR